jgi:hypothetical protein
VGGLPTADHAEGGSRFTGAALLICEAVWQGDEIVIKRSVNNVRLIPLFGLVGGFLWLFSIVLEPPFRYLSMVAAVVLMVLFVRLTLRWRPCGHGTVTQGGSGLRWPYAIKICPICGERLW